MTRDPWERTELAIDALVALGNEDDDAFWEALALLELPTFVEWAST